MLIVQSAATMNLREITDRRDQMLREITRTLQPVDNWLTRGPSSARASPAGVWWSDPLLIFADTCR